SIARHVPRPEAEHAWRRSLPGFHAVIAAHKLSLVIDQGGEELVTGFQFPPSNHATPGVRLDAIIHHACPVPPWATNPSYPVTWTNDKFTSKNAGRASRKFGKG